MALPSLGDLTVRNEQFIRPGTTVLSNNNRFEEMEMTKGVERKQRKWPLGKHYGVLVY
jgi:hypothetical protein